MGQRRLKHVLVIGAGLGALSAAVRLARMGFRVTVFEKNAEIGGKAGERLLHGYRFDTGPSLLTMPFVVDELFAFAGCAREQFLHYVPLEPICRYFFPDGTRLDASSDPARMKAEIARLSAREAAQYEKFLAYSRRIYQLTAEIFLFSPFHEWRRLLRRRNWRTLFSLPLLDPWRTVHQGVARFFSDARLLQLFDRYATYNGSNPYRAPATLNIIPHVEYELGGYYIQGGMRRLVTALAQVMQHLGVELHISHRVEKILHDGKKVTGLQVEGEKVAGDYVLCGQDVVVAYEQSLEGFDRRRRQLRRLEPSCSGLVFLWGVRRTHEQLLHHNIFFSHDYRREFEEIFDELLPPQDPTIYLAITSKSDPAHAPGGGENWFVLLNMPYLSGRCDWRKEWPQVRERVLTKLRRFGLEVASAIAVEEVITPQDFYDLYLSNRGSIYGISSNRRSTAFRRPPNRSRDLEGLYFAGGATHPGGGIPLVLLSGKLAAELIAGHAARS
ncbi:MAG: phytoene desaturase family protein [candidate division KSB1 bacterium]|nr:phytoene desaturase family protein [candidate division KSB1 bacterium]